MKVAITIRCNRCDARETVSVESWHTLKTSCGCNGPYTVLERKPLPEDAAGTSAPAATPGKKG